MVTSIRNLNSKERGMMNRVLLSAVLPLLAGALAVADEPVVEVQPGVDFRAIEVVSAGSGNEGLNLLSEPEDGDQGATILRVAFGSDGVIRLNGAPIGNYVMGTHTVDLQFAAQTGVAQIAVRNGANEQIAFAVTAVSESVGAVAGTGAVQSLTVQQG
jgi:hypothetical protein